MGCGSDRRFLPRRYHCFMKRLLVSLQVSALIRGCLPRPWGEGGRRPGEGATHGNCSSKCPNSRAHGWRRGLLSCASPRLMPMVHNLGIKASPVSHEERQQQNWLDSPLALWERHGL